jgi:hypothetical protein
MWSWPDDARPNLAGNSVSPTVPSWRSLIVPPSLVNTCRTNQPRRTSGGPRPRRPTRPSAFGHSPSVRINRNDGRECETCDGMVLCPPQRLRCESGRREEKGMTSGRSTNAIQPLNFAKAHRLSLVLHLSDRRLRPDVDTTVSAGPCQVCVSKAVRLHPLTTSHFSLLPGEVDASRRS